MPESDRIISIVGDDEDDDESNSNKNTKKQPRGHRRGDGFTRAKRLVMSPFAKAKTRFEFRLNSRRISRKSPSFASSSSPPPPPPSSSSSSHGNANPWKGCCFCIAKPQTLEDSPPVESRSSDPNDPNFSFEMLRALIETNDFYSKECNPHG